jgi:hypothetical protein
MCERVPASLCDPYGRANEDLPQRRFDRNGERRIKSGIVHGAFGSIHRGHVIEFRNPEPGRRYQLVSDAACHAASDCLDDLLWQLHPFLSV